MDNTELYELLGSIRETVECRHDELFKNKQLTNELIVDDLMLGLGYNKKKDTNVKRLFDNVIDWEIQHDNGVSMAVKVYGLGSGVSTSEIEELANYSKDKGIQVIIATDIIDTIVCIVDKSNIEPVYTVHMIEEMNETDIELLKAISKKEFNIGYIKSLRSKSIITVDDVEELFVNNRKAFIDSMCGVTDSLVENCTNSHEQVEIFFNKIVTMLTCTEKNDTDEQIQKLKDQIMDLTSENNSNITTIQSLQCTIDELNEKLEKTSGESRRKALELLSVIDDSDSANRSYVAVINEEIIQFEELHTFVGRVLQILYSIKSFEAQPYIFDGNIFTLESSNTKHNDLIVNNRAYDIMISNDDEDTAIQKLKTIFSHFDDILFEVKKIGKMMSKQVTGIDEDSFIDDTEDDEEQADTQNNEPEDKSESNSDERLLVAQMKTLDSLLWTEEEVDILNIRFIGSNAVTFVINNGTNEDMAYEQMVCKCIDAVVSLSESEQEQQTVIRLKQKNLELIDSVIKPYSEELKDYPRINGTRYVVTSIENSKQVANIVNEICKALDIDTQSIFIYFDAVTASESLISDYGIDIDSVPIINSVLYNAEEITPGVAILRGEMFNHVLISKNSLQVHKDIMKKTLAVKTKYLSRLVNDYTTDIKQIVEAMIVEAISQGKDISKCNIGYVIGEQYKIVSKDVEEVSDNPIELEIDNEVYYMSQLEEWQIAETLLKIHISLFNNASIAVKEQIDIGAVNYYGDDFITSEPSTSLAIQSFVRYVASCVDTK